jgi:hypothetical protein
MSAASPERQRTDRSFVRQLAGAWFALTRDERNALLLVLALFLLGLGVRAWHLRREAPPAPAVSANP